MADNFYDSNATVTSINNLSGDVTLAAGSNITITPSGSTLTIASTGGGSGPTFSGWNVKAVDENGVNINNPGTDTFDGITVTSGDLILEVGYGDETDGVWTFNGSSSPMTRPTYWENGDTVLSRTMILVGAGGGSYGGLMFSIVSSMTVGSDTPAFAIIPAQSANATLSNLTSTAINAALVPAGSIALGSGSNAWSGLFINGTISSIGTPGGNIQMTSGGLFQMHDSSNVVSIDVPNRQLSASDGSGSLDYNLRQIYTPNATTALDWSSNTEMVAAVNLSFSANGIIKTPNKTGSGSQGLQLTTGTSDTADTGQIAIETGVSHTVTDVTTSGSILLRTGSQDLAHTTGGDVATGYVHILTGDTLGESTGGLIQIKTGDSEWQSGDVLLQTGLGTVADDAFSGALTIQSGDVLGAATSGDITIKTGATSGAGTSGALTLQTGTTSSGTRGKIAFKDGSEGSANKVWISSDTNGNGKWDTSGASGSFTSQDGKTITVTSGLITSIV